MNHGEGCFCSTCVPTPTTFDEDKYISEELKKAYQEVQDLKAQIIQNGPKNITDLLERLKEAEDRWHGLSALSRYINS